MLFLKNLANRKEVRHEYASQWYPESIGLF